MMLKFSYCLAYFAFDVGQGKLAEVHPTPQLTCYWSTDLKRAGLARGQLAKRGVWY